MMMNSAMRRAVSKAGFDTRKVPTGGEGRVGFPFPVAWLPVARGRVAGRTTTDPAARLDYDMRISPQAVRRLTEGANSLWCRACHCRRRSLFGCQEQSLQLRFLK
jgi:hypothetical protein